MSYPLEHVRFSFTVTLLADMHVGDGESRKLSELRQGGVRRRASGNRETDPEVATVARAHDGTPTVPATALKGALRKALVGTMADTERKELFGTIRGKDSGAIGRFSFYAAEFRNGPPAATELPFHSADKKTWIATHVAISEKTGAADPQKLFNLEMVPAGTTFLVSGVYFGALAQAREKLARLLAPLAAPGGLAVGSGSKLGRGAVKIEPPNEVKLTAVHFDPDTGDLATPATETLTIAAPAAVSGLTRLKLTCKGPFASVDPEAQDTNRRRNANTIHALRRHRDVPIIHPDSVVGALRARAAWLCAVEGWGCDDRFMPPAKWNRPSELAPVQRLFGVAGWRSLLRIARMGSVRAEQARNLTSIALDRFSGAVLDGTLFVHEVFTGVEFDLDLVLDQRRFADGEAYPNDQDRQLFDALIEDIKVDGVLLGHATNRGFGWFDVARRLDTAGRQDRRNAA